MGGCDGFLEKVVDRVRARRRNRWIVVIMWTSLCITGYRFGSPHSLLRGGSVVGAARGLFRSVSMLEGFSKVYSKEIPYLT